MTASDPLGIPGDPDAAYTLVATVEELPASHPSMYAVHQIADRMCVYRDAIWWCSPTAVVAEVLPLIEATE